MKVSRHDPTYPDRLLARISPTNREIAAAYLTSKRSQGLQSSSIAGHINALVELDSFLSGKPFASASREDMSALLDAYSKNHAAASCGLLCVYLKCFFAFTNDGECPRQLKAGLTRLVTKTMNNVTPLSLDDFHKLLRAAVDGRGPARELWTAHRHALLWVLWDSGFRISEALALRIQDVEFDSDGGARLTLPPDAPDLKTGPRSVYVVECVGALRVWLSIHPERLNPMAPLLGRKDDARERGNPKCVGKLLKSLSRSAGIRNVNPHLFRHTRATRAAELSWTEADLRAYFGWANGSKMPGQYVHLSRRHMTERVRKDANLDPVAQRVQMDPRAAVTEIASASAAAASAQTIRALQDAGLLPPGGGRRAHS